ncbi:hypothetical protein P0O24_01865 [Methanotrichaceae archaeon M04Ac]|jgi:hypothetical protein|uniref:Uncharacterized protein n=1 Tax=Candidatus Methanocrinis alkalitolerans TaxID=3033395 RepID=A0ABT5XCD9_9EURY|nr:hypothetical protein [Candidatus Methanocrinis alkalitolerans]MDF0592330.1 hypothetical protein [Candidatus Methanocrinis alkalitolerans]
MSNGSDAKDLTKTSILPPFTAVRMVWAQTGASSDDEQSQITATLVKNSMKNIREKAEADGVNENEKEYVLSALATMESSLRNLDIAYKGRTLNFEENEKLREAYLDSIKEGIEFGNKAKDLLKSLPTMTIGAVGGVTIVSHLFGDLQEESLWGIGLAFAAAGYLVNLVIVRAGRTKTQKYYVVQDYERGLYYDQYVSRAANILTSLYLDLDRIHKNAFGQRYPVDTTDESAIVDDVLKGVRNTYCKYVHKHMREDKVTHELWPLCETGNEDAVKKCPHWEGK